MLSERTSAMIHGRHEAVVWATGNNIRKVEMTMDVKVHKKQLALVMIHSAKGFSTRLVV
jgi:hypothetical protein